MKKQYCLLLYQIGLTLLESKYPRTQCQSPKNKEQLLDMLKTGEATINQIVHLKNGMIASFIDVCDHQSRFYLEGKNIFIVQTDGTSIKSKLETRKDCVRIINNALSGKYKIDEATKEEILKTVRKKASDLQKLTQ